jgi:hypothetical protein
VAEVVMMAWRLYPESFGLRGYERKHPDSNRVQAKLCGSDGLCGLGWFEHVDTCTYRLTRKGYMVARSLGAMVPSPASPPKTASAAPPRASAPPIQASTSPTVAADEFCPESDP